MQFTEEQKNKIYKLSNEQKLELLDICIEDLGLIDISDSKMALGLSRARIYQLMKSNKIKSIKIGKHIFPLINL